MFEPKDEINSHTTCVMHIEILSKFLDFKVHNLTRTFFL